MTPISNPPGVYTAEEVEDGFIRDFDCILSLKNTLDKITCITSSFIQKPLISLRNSEITIPRNSIEKFLILFSYAASTLLGSLVVGSIESVVKIALGILTSPLLLAQLCACGSYRTIPDIVSAVPLLFFGMGLLSLKATVLSPVLAYQILFDKAPLNMQRFDDIHI